MLAAARTHHYACSGHVSSAFFDGHERSWASAESVVEVPMLAAIHANNLGAFEVLLLRWDHQPSPSPIVLQWQGGNIKQGPTNLGSMITAFNMPSSIRRPSTHTGTVCVIGIAYAATGTDGPSAEAS